MSKIEVNKIGPQCGTTLTVGCGAGQTVVADAATVTLGRCGGTVALASGATQTGFGRTGTVDWQTSIKTAASFTAVNGEGYFVDTSSNAVTANLPAGSVGAIVSFKDYAQNFDTNALTIAANGSEKIEGLTADLILNTEGLATTLVYGDATKGWQSVNSNEVTNTVKYVAATGGSVATVCTNFKVHTFTGPGTFCVSCAGNTGGSNTVDFLVIAGGGGAPGDRGGGGGAGGYRFSSGTASGCYTAGPGPLAASALPVTAQGYPIVVGAGGTVSGSTPPNVTPGSVSSFSSVSSAGGGKGSGQPAPGDGGGSGGGGAGVGGGVKCGQAGNTPPVSPPQGFPGGNGEDCESGPTRRGGGGGGGASVAGTTATTSQNGNGGNGLVSCITASPVTRGGGGGGGGTGGSYPNGGTGGSGGGGNGGTPPSIAGTVNTGGGGGGFHGNAACNGGAGGSGIVIIRYKFQ
jgi:hypothetical protein